jgi:hypothetical protein
MANEQQSAEDLFEAALDLPPERRSAFLDQACCDTPELRRQVDQLLLEEQRAAGFLSSPAFSPSDAAASATTFSPIGLTAGNRLGRYSIIAPLGAGGMGVVYRARDEKLERDVDSCAGSLNKRRCAAALS